MLSIKHCDGFHTTFRPGLMVSSVRAISAALVLAVFTSAASATPILWGIDEDDGQLFSIADYTQISAGATAAGFIDYGSLKWNDGGTLRTIGNDMEAFTLDASGMAYIALDDNLGSTGDQVLLSFDTTTATVGGNNVVTVLGRIAGGSTGNITGLAIDSASGDLLALNKRSGVDKLLKISKTDGSLISTLGPMTGRGATVHSGEDMVFDSAGNLYVTDNDDDEFYRINPLTGAILETVDNNQQGGLGTSGLKLEAIAWDPQNGLMVGFSDCGNFFTNQTLEDGNNSQYGGLNGLTDVEGMAFVPVPEPAALGIILMGGMILPFRRKN